MANTQRKVSLPIARLQALLDPDTLEADKVKNIYQKDVGSGLPKVMIPGQFRPYPIVSGSPGLHTEVRSLLNAVPNLQGRVAEVTEIPTPSVINTALQSRYPVEDLGTSNLLGQTTYEPRSSGKRGNTVWVNPEVSRWKPRVTTLAHEMGHAAGTKRHDAAIEELELIAREFLDSEGSQYQGPITWGNKK